MLGDPINFYAATEVSTTTTMKPGSGIRTIDIIIIVVIVVVVVIIIAIIVIVVFTILFLHHKRYCCWKVAENSEVRLERFGKKEESEQTNNNSRIEED